MMPHLAAVPTAVAREDWPFTHCGIHRLEPVGVASELHQPGPRTLTADGSSARTAPARDSYIADVGLDVPSHAFVHAVGGASLQTLRSFLVSYTTILPCRCKFAGPPTHSNGILHFLTKN